MNPIISIIIPCYNCQQTIRETLQSAKTRNRNDIEIIAIDDGSQDQTLTVLTDYAKENKNVRVISQENKGVSAARNKGLLSARGKYISFLDADDCFGDGYLDLVLKLINDSDLDIVCMLRTNDLRKLDSVDNCLIEIKKTEAYSLLKRYTYSKTDIVFPCFIYKAEIIKQKNIFFSEDIKYGEDWEFVTKVLSNSEKAYLINNRFYFYRVNAQSASRKSIWKQVDVIEAALRTTDYLYKNANPFAREFEEFMVARSYFSVAHRFASSKNIKLYKKLLNTYDLRKYMKEIVLNKKNDLKSRAAATVFLINKLLFYYLARFCG